MFGKKKMEPSRFEDLCSKISTEAIQSGYDNNGLYPAIALTILQGAWDAKDHLLQYPEIGKLFQKTNPDVIVIEAAAAIQSQLAYSLTLNPLDLEEDEEEEMNEAVYDALGLICSLGAEEAEFSKLNEKMATRSYSPRTEKAIERFGSVLRASVDAKEPVSMVSQPSLNGDLLNEISLGTAIMSLWGAIMLSTVETCQNIGRAHFAGEI